MQVICKSYFVSIVTLLPMSAVAAAYPRCHGNWLLSVCNSNINCITFSSGFLILLSHYACVSGVKLIVWVVE